jgi:hypothetical protein
LIETISGPYNKKKMIKGIIPFPFDSFLFILQTQVKKELPPLAAILMGAWDGHHDMVDPAHYVVKNHRSNCPFCLKNQDFFSNPCSFLDHRYLDIFWHMMQSIVDYRNVKRFILELDFIIFYQRKRKIVFQVF